MPPSTPGEEDGSDSHTPRSSLLLPQSSSSSSLTLSSPPAPPPDFNPPADFTAASIETTISAITPPSPDQYDESPLALSSASSGSAPNEFSPPAPFLSRPALQALHRDSNVSSGTNSQSSGIHSIGSAASDGGEHLVEARNELMSHSGHTSGEVSEDDEDVAVSSANPRSLFDLHVITATPPLHAGALLDESRRRYSGGERQEASASWDSVWPTPEAVSRANSSSSFDPSSSSRYPAMAPVSPFVTPAFSPAIFPVGSSRPNPASPHVPIRRSSSPSRRASSPRRPSPFTSFSETFEPENYNLGRRQSITAMDMPPLSTPGSSSSSVSISRHQRSLSSTTDTSPTSRSMLTGKRSTSPHSPPQSPRRLSGLERPDSPARRHRKQTAPQPAFSRLADLGSTSPSDWHLRPRRQSVSARTSPVSSYDDSQPGPSRRHRSPGSDHARASLNEDVPPLDQADILPPPLTSPPLFGAVPGDDGMFRLPIEPPVPLSANLPVYAPLARPAALRRAMSDFETRSPRGTPPGMSRSSSLTADIDKSPTHIASALKDEPRNSPRREVEPLPPIPDPGYEEQDGQDPHLPDPPVAEEVSDVQLVDEGDVLPQDSDLYMDITFEDEGLSTLERIFLLSKSEFAFHRAYIARVLGDLLYDVDPCESVEYVLPLISSFTLDEDEGVREAFAQDLHRIIWYFYSVCRIGEAGTEAQAPAIQAEDWVEQGEDAEEGGYTSDQDQGDYFSPEPEHDDPWNPPTLPHRDDSNQTVTVTSAGVELVDKPSPEELEAAPRYEFEPAPESISSGPTSDASSMSRVALTAFDSESADTPASSIQPESERSHNPPEGMVEPLGTDSSAPADAPLLDRPSLPVDFFTPLLGSLLLNSSTVISESVRIGLVALLARLKDKGELTAERWGTIKRDESTGRRSFASQNGPHSHDFQPIPADERDMLERELLEGLVIGMARLSTEMPEHLFEEGLSLQDGQAALESYAEPSTGKSSSGTGSARSSIGGQSQSSEIGRQREAFQFQLIAEATAGRATSMNLIGALCDYYTSDEVVAWGFVEEVLRCDDGDVPVRAEGAVALSMLAKVAPVEYIYSFIPLFELLANDELAQVRQSACLSLPSLCRRIESPDYRRSFAIKAMHSLTTFNADVRCAALEVLGELIYVFADDPRGPPMELMQVYLDEEDVRRGFGEDWDTVASFNFPGVALTLGSDHWDDIKPLYARMNERAGDKPRRTLAASLHELAKILTPEQCAEDLMPVYRTCVTGADEIRELVFEHIDIFLAHLPLPLAWDTYLELAQGWKENTLGGWRAREQLALHIPAFFEIFHSVMDDEVLGVLKDALLDPFAAVRDAATKGIPQAYEVLGDESHVTTRFRENLLDLGRSPRYRQRQTFVRCLREFVKPPPNRQAFEDFFLPFLSSLSKDVVDVRLGLAQTVADLFVVGAFYGDKVHAPKAIYDLARQLSDDEAVDVRDTIRYIDLDHFETNDTVPYEVKKSPTVNRAVRPEDLVPDHAPVQPKPLSEEMRQQHHELSAAETTGADSSPDVSDAGDDDVSPDLEQRSDEFEPGPAGEDDDPTPIAASPGPGPQDGITSPMARATAVQPDGTERTLFNHRADSFRHRIQIERRSSPDPIEADVGEGAGAGAGARRFQYDTALLTPRTPAGGWGSGHYLSSPSPSEPRGGADPFSASFAQATPEGSPYAETRALEPPGLTGPSADMSESD